MTDTPTPPLTADERRPLVEEFDRLSEAGVIFSEFDAFVDGYQFAQRQYEQRATDAEAALAAERERRERAETEYSRLRFALGHGGLGVMAECPSCGAERTNGERHADDCPIFSDSGQSARLKD